MNIKYGDIVTITSKLTRFSESREKGDGGKYLYRGWSSHPLLKPETGIFIGCRTLCSGRLATEVMGHYEDGAPCFDQPYLADAEYQRVALVSPGPNRNPVYVALEDCHAA